jgi:hypothetical protein
MPFRALLLAISIAALASLGTASPSTGPPGSVTLTVALPQPYTPRPAAGAKDDYRCFLLDPKLKRNMFLTRAKFQPGAPAIVHHIILFRVRPEQVAAAAALDRRTAGAGWSCFGGTGLDDLARGAALLNDAGWVAAWAPSRRSDRAPTGVGVPLAKRSRLIMQVHYSLYAHPRPDRTRVVLSLVPQAGSSLKPLRTMLLPAPVELACLPGESGGLCDRTAALSDLVKRHGAQAALVPAGLLAFCDRDPRVPEPTTITACQLRFDEPVTIHAAAGHMHLLGKSLTLELDPGTPRARTILSIPRWDFHDQRLYVLSPPVRVATGDALRVTCEHDQRLRRVGPPRYVLWGEGTADEMCLGVLQVTSR